MFKSFDTLPPDLVALPKGTAYLMKDAVQE